MICPDPAYRISAMQAYHHPALQPVAPSVIVTPHFVREAAAFDEEEEPLPLLPSVPITLERLKDESAKPVNGEKRKRKKKKDIKEGSRAATPTALGESIKQHTSMPRIAAPAVSGRGDKDTDEITPSPTKKKGSRMMLKPLGRGDEENKGDEEDPTRKCSSCSLCDPC